MKATLVRYFDDVQWAQALVERGALRFRSLSYYRDYEDSQVRGDELEGTVVHRPEGGLSLRQGGRSSTIDGQLESAANPDEILVYCLSLIKSDRHRQEFKASAYVEVLNPSVFCARVVAKLPPHARFVGKPGRTRLGHHVQYYDLTDAFGTRWALPGQIAISKRRCYSWQAEFRLVFSITNALDFQNVTMRIVRGDPARSRSSDHPHFDLEVGSLTDICVIKEC